jgi:type I restriction enzyme S subunit
MNPSPEPERSGDRLPGNPGSPEGVTNGNQRATQGWRIAKISDFAKTTSGGTPSRANPEFYTGNIPWIKSGDLNDGNVSEATEFITEEALKSSSAKLFPAGTLMIALYGATIGKLGILTIEAATNQAVCGIFVPEGVETKYLFYFLLKHRRELIKQGAGGAQPNISQGIIRDIEVPLPPLPEQRRVVARIEELFSRLDAGVAALRHAKAQLQRYRQSVLAAAVTGQLTQAWRERHPQGEPATEMLGDLLDRLANGTTAEQSKEPPGIPVSRIETISNATINYKRVRYVREIDREKCAQFMVRDGDILFSHINSDLHLGKTAVAIGNRELLHGMNLLLMRPCERINAKYLNYVLTHLRFSGYFMSIAQHAVNQSSLNQKKLMAIPIPVPAIAEQRQVVAEVEARTTAIDHLEAELDRQITRSNRLRQSTLAAAFSGQF